ncbi:MAG: hypothetical protein WA874_02235 [Chryseosolibacter sp.]
MKNTAIAFVASLFLFASCGQKAEDGAHTHEDGSTHADHAADTTQEEFNAADTTHHAHDSTEHGHSH